MDAVNNIIPRSNINLALISPNKDAYSETFIQNHKNKIDANIKFLFGGLVPLQSEDGYLLTELNFVNKTERKIEKLFFSNKLDITERAVVRYFRQHNIQVVLAEFGMTGVEMMKICRYLALPLIVHFHGIDAYHKKILEQYSSAYKKLFAQAFKIIAVSKDMVQQLLKLGCPQQKIVLNPYGPSDFFFDVHNNYQSDNFLSVGRFVEKKAPQKTIEAFNYVVKKYPAAHLKMAGDGPLFETCKALIKTLHLESNIELPGVLNRDKIGQLLSESIAFVQHSITAENGDTEGTPVAILEASAAGLPVISTKHAGIPEVIIDKQTGFLVEENDIEGMAKNMIKILQDKAFSKKMGLRGRDRIKHNFSLTKHITILDEIIHESITNTDYRI